MSDTLTHITLTTGHSATTARSDVRDDVLMRLQPIIDAEAGLVPEAGVYLDFIRPLDPMTHRPPDGWTDEELLALERKRLELLLRPIVVVKEEG